MKSWTIPKVPRDQVNQLRHELLLDSRLSLNYLVLAVCSCIIATIGLVTNSPAVIIGAMIVAPLMMPLRGLALAAVEGDFRLFRCSVVSIAVGAILAIALSALVHHIIGLPESGFASEIRNRTQPNLADLGVALAAGAVSAFAKIRPRLSDAVAGTAIAVALMPPLCVVGIYLSTGNWDASQGALLLYITNLLGITFAAITVFILNGYYFNRDHVRQAILVGSILTGLIAIPLLRSFLILLNQAKIQDTLRTVLERETVTLGQQITTMENLQIDWNVKPHVIVIEVETIQPITPFQVQLVEEYLRKRLESPVTRFVLDVRVSRYQQVLAQPLIYPAKRQSQLLHAAQLRLIMKEIFIQRKILFNKNLDLINLQIDWLTDPPAAQMQIESDTLLTQSELDWLGQLSEQLLHQRTGVTLDIRVQQFTPPQ
jgi:uncharacterized hydrophobic protein (TIGR00271 family)